MQNVNYYQEQAGRARRLAAGAALRQDVTELLQRVARDYEEIADDLITGAIEVRHPDLMPQRRHTSTSLESD
jgi:hypothetical protein